MARTRTTRRKLMPVYADPEEIKERAQDMPDAYLLCLGGLLNHPWTYVGVAMDQGERLFTFRCDRCGTVKEVTLTWYGARVGQPRYKNPKDYGFKGLGIRAGDARDALRAVSMDVLAPVEAPTSLNGRRKRKTTSKRKSA